ncbi:AfsR/SARP family transcriptional regulator [Kutzneria chonburiensis]|uniref:BTAD domain-containing putative transcriptional regulator n=1 Tax=Kutzneria chonburiensis TaxID=1483604 RepID=A0ABV6N283_9PSEU|nr:BTAD domain-containing putative transcriptional regulator [Kutzneria chonburiensis]
MTVRFRVLGPVSALAAGRPIDLGHARQRGVLAVLLLAPNHPVSADQLMARVWGDTPPQRGREVLYSYLSRLRVAVAGPAGVEIQRGRGGYTLVVDPADVDVHRFREMSARARAAGPADQALKLFDEALDLWHDKAFADVDSTWLDAMRQSLDAERRAVELDRTDAALRCGRHAELLADLDRQTARHPLDERVAGQLMLALYRAGRQADALSTYQRLREELAEQLGADPNPALRQLHQQILTADPALSAPARATGTSAPTPRHLPLAPAGFTGRATELATLTAAVETASADPTTVLITALAGAGGIGKTSLALHWAHTHADRFPDGQLFVDLRGFSPDSEPLDPLTAARGFLDALGVDSAHVGGGLDEHTARYRSQIAGKRMLVVLDNAATADQVTPLLPGTSTCTVLITSRAVLTPLLSRHNARHLNLDVLTGAEARALLVQRLGQPRVTAEPNVVAEMIQLCGRYPLALTIMAGRAQALPDLPLTDFLAELRGSGLDALDDADPTASLPAVLSWSLRGLTDQQRTAFAVLGIAPGPDIGLPAAASLIGQDLPETRTVLRTLVEASLLHRKPHDRYAMHDLIRTYATTTAHHDLNEQQQEAALLRVCDFYARAADSAARVLSPHRRPLELGAPPPGVQDHSLPDDKAALAWSDTEHAALLAAQHIAADHGWHQLVWQLAWNLETYHDRQGHRHDRLAVWLAAAEATAPLPDPTAHILAQRRLGAAHAELGQRAEAFACLDQAIALAEHHHDTNQLAHTHHALARACEQWGESRRALGHATSALHHYRTLGQPVGEASACNLVGWFAAQQGDYDSARQHCLLALALHRRHQNLAGEAETLDSLGYIDHHTGRHRQAVDHYNQALALTRAIGYPAQGARTLEQLGHVHTALGEGKQAQAVWREALELYREQGRDSDAERVQRQLDQLDDPGVASDGPDDC